MSCSQDMKKTSLILGQGPVGQLLAQSLRQENFEVLTWAKSERQGQTYYGDLATSKSLLDVPPVDILIIVLSSKERSAQAYKYLYETTLKIVLSSLKFSKVIFCSSTAVYPDDSSYMQDEDQCQNYSFHFRGQYLLKAEKLVRYYSPQEHIILRVGGIVRPDSQDLYKGSNAVEQKTLVNLVIALVSEYSHINGIYNICSDKYLLAQRQKAKIVSNLKIKSKLGSQFYDAC